jgi:hypothetical protein
MHTVNCPKKELQIFTLRLLSRLCNKKKTTGSNGDSAGWLSDEFRDPIVDLLDCPGSIDNSVGWTSFIADLIDSNLSSVVGINCCFFNFYFSSGIMGFCRSLVDSSIFRVDRTDCIALIDSEIYSKLKFRLLIIWS